jgi:DNA invertase Pin-like site-specific DNA recombinase
MNREEREKRKEVKMSKESKEEQKEEDRETKKKAIETLLEPDNTSVTERCKRRGISVSTYYRVRKQIIESLSALL